MELERTQIQKTLFGNYKPAEVDSPAPAPMTTASASRSALRSRSISCMAFYPSFPARPERMPR